MSEVLLSSAGLSKRYGSKLALDQVDIHVHAGDIYGLIGRNGAGKTTLLKIVNRQIYPTAGEISLKGYNLKQPGALPCAVGSLVESPNLYPECTARDNLYYKCLASGIRDLGQIDDLLRLVELADTGKKKARQFSLGMKQRLGIALALLGNPPLLLLDEPINGMDPQGIVQMRELIVRLNRERGTTIVISSHILDELAKFATAFGIIKDGQLIRELSRGQLEEQTQSSIHIITPQADQAEALLRDSLGITRLTRPAPQQLYLEGETQRSQTISRALFDAGIYVEEFHVKHQTLEDYFMQLTGGAHV